MRVGGPEFVKEGVKYRGANSRMFGGTDERAFILRPVRATVSARGGAASGH